jgi:hypothetical protein
MLDARSISRMEFFLMSISLLAACCPPVLPEPWLPSIIESTGRGICPARPRIPSTASWQGLAAIGAPSRPICRFSEKA